MIDDLATDNDFKDVMLAIALGRKKNHSHCKMVIFSIVIVYVLLISCEKKLCLNLMLPLMWDIEAFK